MYFDFTKKKVPHINISYISTKKAFINHNPLGGKSSLAHTLPPYESQHPGQTAGSRSGARNDQTNLEPFLVLGSREFTKTVRLTMSQSYLEINLKTLILVKG